MTLSTGTSTRIRVQISARVVGFISLLPLLLVLILIPLSINLRACFIVIIYTIGMVGFCFDVWWTRDLFEKKILSPIERGRIKTPT